MLLGRHIGEKLAWGLILCSWLFAFLVANGAELSRLAPLAVASLCAVVFAAVSGKVQCGKGILAIGGATAYFLFRATVSPIADEALRDILLVAVSFSAFVVASLFGRERWAQNSLLGLVLVGLLVAAGLSFYQLVFDKEFAFLRGPRADLLGVSGPYFHRNYLAGFLEIAVPILLAFTLSKPQRLVWFLWVAIGLGLVLALMSQSRAGFRMTLFGTALVSVAHLTARERKAKSARKLVLVWGGGAVLLLVAVLAAKWGVEWIFLERTGTKTLQVDSHSLQARLGLFGIGFDIWSEHPLFGAGAESYSYLFPRYRSALLHQLFGDARMAHSEFVQVAADYGIIGILALGVILTACGLRLATLWKSRKELWIAGAGLGALGAEVGRAFIDFNLHIAPNLILLALILGFCFSTDSQLLETRGRRVLGCLALFLAFAFTGWAVFKSGPQLQALPSWLKVERAKISQSATLESSLRAYSRKTEEFRPSRALARLSTGKALETEAGSARRQVAITDLSRSLAGNPYDAETLSNLGRFLEEEGEFETAHRLHRRAIAFAGSRERVYGVYYAYGWHLVKRGRAAYLAKQPEEALAYFLAAQDMLERSKGYAFGKGRTPKEMMAWLEPQTKFLQNARIEPAALDFLPQPEEVIEDLSYSVFSWDFKKEMKVNE